MTNLRLYFTGLLFVVLLSGCATAGKVSRVRGKVCLIGDFRICFVCIRSDMNINITFAQKGDSLYKIYSMWNYKHDCRGKSVELKSGETYRLYLYPLYDESECENRDIADMFNMDWLEENHISPDCCVRNVFIATNLRDDCVMKRPCRFAYRRWRDFEEPDLDLPFPKSFMRVTKI